MHPSHKCHHAKIHNYNHYISPMLPKTPIKYILLHLSWLRLPAHTLQVKRKGSPHSTAERRVPELIPVLGSQPAGDVSHKPGGRLPLLSARARSYPRNP